MADTAACTPLAHSPSAPRVNTTIRVSNIPISISRAVLQKYLQELKPSLGTIAETSAGDLYISLAPEASEEGHLRFQVATVTFSRLIHDPTAISLGPLGDTFEATVDTHFRGLTPLNNPEDPAVDIIAVTGLAGHAFGSWRSRAGYGMWLRDFLPSDMEENGYRARVFTYGYDTTLIGSHSHAGIDHFSKQFIEAVKGARSKCSSRPLILIGHSLGGLVIKEAIIQCIEDGKGSILGAFPGILFFSVPHKGLADARLLCMVHEQPNKNLVQDLCENSQFLRRLDRSFGHHMNVRGMGTDIISFYETDETQTVKELSSGVWGRCGPYVRMVTEESVKHAAVNGQYFSMDADHSSIVKFADRSDQKYQLVRGKLLGIARTISIPPSETEVPCQERTRVCEWLYPGVVDKKHREISENRLENTGGWLLTHYKFTSWNGGSGPRLLWGCGIPGAGKTFLSSLVIDVLHARSKACSSTIGLAYIYFDYMDQDQQVPITVLRSLIRQLVSKPNFPIPKAVQSLYDRNRAAGTTPGLEDLRNALAATLALFTETFFVFDALDECREDTRKQLLPLIHWIAGSGTRIFLTSRPYQDIALSLTPPGLNSHVDRLEIAAREEDVMIYVENKIQDHDDARDLIKDDFRAKVVSKLVDACKGMFLLVRFYIEDLCEYPTTEDIRIALEGVGSAIGTEKALHETYGRVMDSIRVQHASRTRLALKALTWLLTAHRTLDVDELRMAVAMGDGSRVGNHNPFNEAEMPDQSLILGVCRGLVMIDHNSHTIKFVHYSVHEYLDKTNALGNFAKRHLTVALGLLDHVWLSYIEPEPRRDCLLDYGKFIDYARGYLHTHMQVCHYIAPTETLLGFLRNTDLVRYLGGLQCWSCEPRLTRVPAWDGDAPRGYGLLHEATAWGSTILVNWLLDDGVDIPVEAGAVTPLHVGSGEGMVELVSLWLDKGVDVNATDGSGKTPLTWAIRAGMVGAAEVLLRRRADPIAALQAPDWDNKEASNPLMLELLFQFGLSVEHKLKQGLEPWITFMTYLVHAIWYDDSAVVKLLLRKGARIHSRNKWGSTPLHEAASHRRTAIARLLLQHGYGGHEDDEGDEDVCGYGGRPGCGCSNCGGYALRAPAGSLVDAANLLGKTPLCHAAEYGNPDMLRVLLSHGIDGSSSGRVRAPRMHEHAAAINARDKSGKTTLSYAADMEKPRTLMVEMDKPRTDMVEMLIDAGADLTLPYDLPRPSYTMLHAAAEKGHVTLFKAALDVGLDPHARDDSNVSALHLAAHGGSVEVVSLLMEKGLSVDLRDDEARTPLHYARGTATIAFLLERGACISSTDTSGSSPLHCRLVGARVSLWACISFDDWDAERMREDVRLLIDSGADVDARNKSGATPLHLAARGGNLGTLTLLLEYGAEMGALDVNQMSVMHHAATSWYRLDAISFLIDRGLSIEERDIKQRTPLHHAARIPDAIACPAKIRLFLEKGASVDPRDSDGYTPLGCLAAESSESTFPNAASSLISAGADVNAVHAGGVSVLHDAAGNGNRRLLPELLRAGANIHACDSDQRTPLHHAALGHSEKHGLYFMCPWYTVVGVLITRGANVNAIDKDQNSPLHVAARKGCGCKGLLALLLDAGADRTAYNSNQETPLDIAINCGFSADFTELLVDRPSEHRPASQVETQSQAAEVVEVDNASSGNETPGTQYPEDEPARKRQYSIAFPPKPN
ncbi:ankyrin repeat-containing domain protein [Morchella snyderi]|nr:ankyrin repeat-containing domain protein [Morchella snyderi]